MLRNAPSVQIPQSMLVNRVDYGTQVQLRLDQDRLVATQTDPSYITWQGVTYSLGQVTNYLSSYSDQYSSNTPESWDNEQPRWVPYHEGLPRHFGDLSGGGPIYDLHSFSIPCLVVSLKLE